MDETAFRQALTSSISRNCPFEKTILIRCAACSEARKHNIAEREAVSCNSALAHDRCQNLRDQLRRNFTFVIGKYHIDGPLPHAKEMRILCGGLKGIQFVLDGTDEVHDISILTELTQARFGDFADLPFSQIVQLANYFYKAR